ncbi:MAG TPA: hypothetical protein VFQ44_26940 [Streptosporangiaceae bacterium]|nr:hypothetical protein [Streptosporangiaceae bacterium]
MPALRVALADLSARFTVAIMLAVAQGRSDGQRDGIGDAEQRFFVGLHVLVHQQAEAVRDLAPLADNPAVRVMHRVVAFEH